MSNSEPHREMTAHVAVLDRGEVSVRAVPLPPRAPGEIDVRITTAAICGSDLHTALGHRAAPPLAALGHEGVGIITAVDADAIDARGQTLQCGDRVILSMLDSCGRCDRCHAGLTMKCRSLRKFGHGSISDPPYATGMLADVVRLTVGTPMIKVVDAVPDAVVVSAGCAGATAAAVVAAAAPAPGEAALVLGAGAVGFFCAMMLSTAGCVVTVRDPSSERLALLANSDVQLGDEGEESYAIVVEASGSSSAFVDAVHACDVGGRLIVAGSVSLGATTVTFDPAVVVTRRLELIGIHNYTTSDFVTAVEWLLVHGEAVGVSRLASPVLPLREVDTAFTLMTTGEFARVLVSAETEGVRRPVDVSRLPASLGDM